jgi:hypothetical protein
VVKRTRIKVKNKSMRSTNRKKKPRLKNSRRGRPYWNYLVKNRDASFRLYQGDTASGFFDLHRVSSELSENHDSESDAGEIHNTSVTVDRRSTAFISGMHCRLAGKEDKLNGTRTWPLKL